MPGRPETQLVQNIFKNVSTYVSSLTYHSLYRWCIVFRWLLLFGKEHEGSSEKFMPYSFENCEQLQAHHTNSLQTYNDASIETNDQLLRKIDIM